MRMLAVMMALFSATAAAQERAHSLTGVRFGDHGDRTRIVLDLAGAPSYEIFTLSGERKRLVVDLEGADFALPGGGGSGSGPGKALVDGYRYAKNSPQTARVVFDLAAPVRLRDAFMIPPSAENSGHRLVLDLMEEDEAAFAARSGFVADSIGLARPEDAVVSAQKIIVIDPGHGGRDPGALGSGGLREKAATLQLAKALKAELERRGGYAVSLTRSNDSYVDHAERTRIARKAGADLFISLHADANRDRSLRGASVYTLDESASDRFAKEMREQGEPLFEFDTGEHAAVVDDILLALAERETRNQSGVFAETLIEHLADATPLLNNSHRRANYYVLLAPDVPAVLVELAFLSNRSDEANLQSAQWRRNMIASISDAIDAYFDQQGVRHAAATRRSAGN